MNGIILGIITTGFGLLIGFFGNYFIAKFNARNEIKKSTAEKRADSYIELWKLCRNGIDSQEEQKKRFKKLKIWYTNGGGLLLPFKATDRFVGALNLLRASKKLKLSDEQLKKLKSDLSWLRTEMKYEVGSYSRKEADKILPNTK